MTPSSPEANERATVSNLRMQTWFPIVAALLLLFSVPTRGQLPEPITDPDAYALYSILLSPMWTERWTSRWQPPLVLLSETDLRECRTGGRVAPTPEWIPVVDDFVRQNARPSRLVPSMLEFGIPYSLISRADLDADDARLALKYPGTWQSRPESKEYAAVSAVGFSADKSKAMLIVGMRSHASVYFMEKRDGRWVKSYVGCGWIA